jgi:hypothetical protein
MIAILLSNRWLEPATLARRNFELGTSNFKLKTPWPSATDSRNDTVDQFRHGAGRLEPEVITPVSRLRCERDQTGTGRGEPRANRKPPIEARLSAPKSSDPRRESSTSPRDGRVPRWRRLGVTVCGRRRAIDPEWPSVAVSLRLGRVFSVRPRPHQGLLTLHVPARIASAAQEAVAIADVASR